MNSVARRLLSGDRYPLAGRDTLRVGLTAWPRRMARNPAPSSWSVRIGHESRPGGRAAEVERLASVVEHSSCVLADAVAALVAIGLAVFILLRILAAVLVAFVEDDGAGDSRPRRRHHYPID